MSVVLVGTAEYDSLCCALQFIEGFGRLGSFGGRNNESQWWAEICSQRFLYGGSGRLKKQSSKWTVSYMAFSIKWPGRKPIGIPRFAVLWLTKTRS